MAALSYSSYRCRKLFSSRSRCECKFMFISTISRTTKTASHLHRLQGRSDLARFAVSQCPKWWCRQGMFATLATTSHLLRSTFKMPASFTGTASNIISLSRVFFMISLITDGVTGLIETRRAQTVAKRETAAVRESSKVTSAVASSLPH